MDAQTSSGERIVPFKSAKKHFADLNATAIMRVVASGADIALIIVNGVIKDVALSNNELAKNNFDVAWRGKKWIDVVTSESRPKIEDLLKAQPATTLNWRQVNHPTERGAVAPVKYVTIRMDDDGRILALGRDLRPVSVMQQRLVQAHQDLERDYDRRLDAEARFRLLFHIVDEAILIVDAGAHVIEEANPAAAAMFGETIERLAKQPLSSHFQERHRRAIERVLLDALSGGGARLEKLKTRKGRPCQVSVSPFALDDKIRFILRVADVDGMAASPAAASWLMLADNLPDAIVFVDSDFRILEVNKAFADSIRATGPRQALGRRLSEFLGRSSTEVNVLISGIRNNGFVRNFATVSRDRFGTEAQVEVSATVAATSDGDVYGLSIRNVARRMEASGRFGEELPQSAEQVTGLVGKMSLKEIVRESTDLIEKLCIDAALEITEHNRASAADMLGLSRQALYTKLKRFGFDE